MSEKSTLDAYLARVEDEDLRTLIRAEIEKTTTRFGLVFERHQPEGIRMPKTPVRRGSKVVLEPDGTYHRVLRLEGTDYDAVAMLTDEDGKLREVPVRDLTVARAFGDVMYPGLSPLGSLRRGPVDAPVHTVINGENYHALEMLQYTHLGKVDLIYIDPPYNTGNKTWKYNDRYIAEADTYRHSKWLSFMEKRLKLAKELLKPTGVIIVAIGDDEHHRLRMLMDEVFGERRFISDVVWQGGAGNDSAFVHSGADYMLIYARDQEALKATGARWRHEKKGLRIALAKAQELLASHDGDATKATTAYRKWVRGFDREEMPPSVARYNRIEAVTGRLYRSDLDLSWPGGGGPNYNVFHPTTGKPCAIPSRGWIYSDPERMQEEIDAGRVVFGPDETKVPSRLGYLDELETEIVKSVFVSPRSRGAKHLDNAKTGVFKEKRFPNPKDHEVIAEWISLTSAPDAVVLDFFGGSGTTAEAVMRLNAGDGGTRQCILVTNNELAAKDDARLRKTAEIAKLVKKGIGPGHPEYEALDIYEPGDAEYEALGVFEHVTRPRIETVVTGFREDGSKFSEGLAANVEFFKLAYLDEARVDRGAEFEALSGVFWLRSGGRGVVLQRESLAQGYALSADSATAVLFRLRAVEEFVEKLEAGDWPVLTHVFIVCESDSQGDRIISKLPTQYQVERIYGSYLTAFQINKEG